MDRLLINANMSLLMRPDAWSLVSAAASGALRRCLHSSTWAQMPGVFVPSMGDSISEGTVAAILKKQGDTVQMDETIAQIETDKVTIDIKASVAGSNLQLLVELGAIVKPGQLVASLSESADAPFHSSMADPPVQFAASAKRAPAQQQAAGGERTPSIRFPPRLTAAGERISDMPPSKQEEVLRMLVSQPSSSSSSSNSSGSAAAKPAASATSPPAPAAAAATIPSAAKPAKVPVPISPFEAPARRQLTEREMDFINSGGAQ